MSKKKLGKLLTKAACLGLAAAVLTGCGEKKDQPEAGSEQVAEAATEALSEEAADANSTEAAEAATKEESDGGASGLKYTVKGTEYEYDHDDRVFLAYVPGDNWDKRHMFCLDTKGNVTGRHSKEVIAEVLDRNEVCYCPITFLMEKDGIVYCLCSETVDYGYGADAVFAIDPDKGLVKKLFRVPSDGHIDTFDFYDGYFYSAVQDYNGSDTVYKITKAKDDFSFEVKEDNTHKDLYASLVSIQGSHFISETKVDRVIMLTDMDMECYERKLAENGFLIRRADSDYYFVDAAGKKTGIDFGMNTPSSITTYDSQFIFFVTRDEYDEVNELYCYEIDMKRTSKLPVDATGIDSKMYYQDGVLYYIIRGDETATLHSYDLATGEDKKLSTRSKASGQTGDYEPFNDFSIEDGAIFIKDLLDYEPSWYVAELKDVDGTLKRLNLEKEMITVESKEERLAKYGKLETVKEEGLCPYCGEALDTVQVDVFTLDPSYSASADKINNALKARTDSWLATAHIERPDVTQDSCGKHDLYFMTHFTTYTVDDVNIIEDRYLAVSEGERYTQTEGPSDLYKRQYLFDLQTGEELNIMSFYTGTEDELKTLLATKVKEDFQKTCAEEGETFDSKAADESYKSAFLKADLEAIYFEENGIKCFFHSYDFSYGPYSSDFFIIHVSYKELLGRDKLTP